MKFICFDLMPYRGLNFAEREKHRSAWVVLPNSLYDPQLGAADYEGHIDNLVYAEELGFDGISVNEHHQTAYGLMPAPNIIADSGRSCIRRLRNSRKRHRDQLQCSALVGTSRRLCLCST